MSANPQRNTLAETLAAEPKMVFPESLNTWGDKQPEDAFSRAAATTLERFVDTQVGTTGKVRDREPYISLWDLTKVERLRGMIAHAMREMVAWSGSADVGHVHRIVVAGNIADRGTMGDTQRRYRDKARNKIIAEGSVDGKPGIVRMIGAAMEWQDIETRRAVKRELTGKAEGR